MIVSTSSSSSSQLAGPPGERRRRLAQVLGRVVADLLQRGQQLQHQAAAGHAARCRAICATWPRAPRPRTARPARRELHGLVGLGLRRQLRRDARVGLAAAQQERARRAGTAAARPPPRRRRPRSAWPTRRGTRRSGAEQAGRRPVQDRPQLGEVVLHRRAGQRDRGLRAGMRAQRARGAGERGSSPAGPRRPRPGPRRCPREPARRPGASCRTWSARTRPAIAGSVRSGAVVAPHGRAGGEPADLALPVAEQRGRADHQRRPAVSGSAWRCRWRAIRVIVLPRPMSSARQPPSPSEAIRSSQRRPRSW